MLTALCLDLMDTLVADPYREALEAATGLGLRDIAELREPGTWPAFEIAAIDEAEFVRTFFATGVRDRHAFDIEAFHRVRRDGYALLPGIAALLDDTDGRIARYLASNYPVWVEEVAARFGLDERLDAVLASHHLGVRKPEAAFYERLLDRIGHEPSACLFVDDREDNCAAAEAAGMRAHHFTGADGLRARLVAEGVLDPAA
jgi:FMN hydrolase / 5-amino-6-(5-phospho-D-ribitylamino)uracil phosphatase